MADVADFDGLVIELERLAGEAEGLAVQIDEVMVSWPRAPGMIPNAANMARQSVFALRRGIARVEQLTAIAESREQRVATHAEERKYDAHTKAMAAQMGITPEAFLELQADRRRGMRGPAGTVTYSPDHEVIR